jgi:hypothetical protein
MTIMKSQFYSRSFSIATFLVETTSQARITTAGGFFAAAGSGGNGGIPGRNSVTPWPTIGDKRMAAQRPIRIFHGEHSRLTPQRLQHRNKFLRQPRQR